MAAFTADVACAAVYAQGADNEGKTLEEAVNDGETLHLAPSMEGGSTFMEGRGAVNRGGGH